MRAVQSEVGMHIEFFLEEESAAEALKFIVSKILSNDVSREFHPFRGKQHLLKNLPVLLKGYKPWIPDTWRIMVLIDKDQEDCFQLKAQLEGIAHDAGFVTKSSASQEGDFQVVNRLVIEELEAWFFGDIEALRTVYPRVSKHLQYQARYRDPDAITGGTYQALDRLLRRLKYHRGGLLKTAVAQNIAQHMEPSRNRSKSFQVFVEGLKACVGTGGLRNQ